jgi:hypothetical protein
MGSQIYADKKMQYYPTSSIETMRILCVLSSYTYLLKDLEMEFREKYSSIIRSEYETVNNETAKQDYRYHDKYSKYQTNYICDRVNLHRYLDSSIDESVCSDLFSGEGNWLKLFKANCDKKRPNILIGNEIEENRYNELIQEGLIDYHYNLAFEDLQLPKKIINIMLFNPPYGISNGERNVRRYFRMMLDKDIMAKNCRIVMVLKQDDLLNISDLITQYFEKLHGYRTHQEEFDKFGQIVLYATLRKTPLNLNNINEVSKYKETKTLNENIINKISEVEFDYTMINSYSQYDSSKGNVYRKIFNAFENFNYINKTKAKISKMNKTWKWIMAETKSVDLSEETMTIPKPLKAGELANIIASGKINGEMSLDNGIGNHVAVGGVRRTTSTKNITVKNSKGEIEDKQETTVENIPYLNLLINNNGKLEIKELSNYHKESEGEVEE